MASKIKNPNLASEGRLRAEWAEFHMPAIKEIVDEYRDLAPFKGVVISACLHVTKETAVLVKALKNLGAEVALAGSNPLTTQDDIASYLVSEGINVFAWRGETAEEYDTCISNILDFNPNIIIDDGGDAHIFVHEKRDDLLEAIIGGTEETTTGVRRLKALSNEGKLKYPVMAVNDAKTKRIFDNEYGTGQSTIDGILRSTSLLLAGKTFVVCGFGFVGRGIAKRARGMGSNVIVTEVDPIYSLEACVEGFKVLPIESAARLGDIFVTATGQTDVIRGEHICLMKDGVILANSGHFNVEISIMDLEGMAVGKRRIRENIEEYELNNGRRLYLLGEGRLVNLVAAEGHPPEVMMCSFANQLLSVKYLVEEGKQQRSGVYNVPLEIDSKVADFMLRGWNIKIDKLSEKQKRYAKSWY